MFDDFIAATKETTFNARGWSEYFDEVLQQRVDDRNTALLTIAFSRVEEEMKTIALAEIEKQALSTREFSNPVLLKPLLTAFGKEGFILVDKANRTVYTDPITVAGSLDDFWEGVEGARLALGVSTETTPERKRRFWRRIVYARPAVYSHTIGARLDIWGDLAPYWHWVEYGNREFAADGAFPTNSPRPFLATIEQKIKALFRKTLKEVEFQEENLVETSLEKFVSDPESFEPYAVLETFYNEGREYFVYVTATRRIGVALPKTYKRLQKR